MAAGSAPAAAPRRLLLTPAEAERARTLVHAGRLPGAAALVQRATGLDAAGAFGLARRLQGSPAGKPGAGSEDPELRAYANGALLRLGARTLLAALLLGTGAVCAWRLAGPFDALSFWLPAMLSLLGLWAALGARAPGGGLGTALAGVALAPVAAWAALTATPTGPLPLPGLPLTLASGTLIALGSALALYNQLCPPGALSAAAVAARRRARMFGRLVLAFYLLTPGLALYWLVLAGARDARGFADLFGFMVFELVYAPALALLVAGLRGAAVGLAALALPLGAGTVQALRPGLGFDDGLLHCALLTTIGPLLALGLLALGRWRRRRGWPGLLSAGVMLGACLLTLALGWPALETLLLEWRARAPGPEPRSLLWLAAPLLALVALLLLGSRTVAGEAQAGTASSVAARKVA